MTSEAKKAPKTFKGKCTPVEMTAEINQWYDATDDWRVTGTTLWVQPDPAKFEGTTVLYVGAKNPNDENRGKWEMTWESSIIPNEKGLQAVGNAKGIGMEGEVKGMEAIWTYTLNYVGDDFPNPANPTFFYNIEGSITKIN